MVVLVIGSSSQAKTRLLVIIELRASRHTAITSPRKRRNWFNSVELNYICLALFPQYIRVNISKTDVKSRLLYTHTHQPPFSPRCLKVYPHVNPLPPPPRLSDTSSWVTHGALYAPLHHVGALHWHPRAAGMGCSVEPQQTVEKMSPSLFCFFCPSASAWKVWFGFNRGATSYTHACALMASIWIHLLFFFK